MSENRLYGILPWQIGQLQPSLSQTRDHSSIDKDGREGEGPEMLYCYIICNLVVFSLTIFGIK